MAEKAAVKLDNVRTYKGVRVVKVPLVLVEFTDKESVKQTKLAVIIGEEVRFLASDALSNPAQDWLSSNILKAVGVSD